MVIDAISLHLLRKPGFPSYWVKSSKQFLCTIDGVFIWWFIFVLKLRVGRFRCIFKFKNSSIPRNL